MRSTPIQHTTANRARGLRSGGAISRRDVAAPRWRLVHVLLLACLAGSAFGQVRFRDAAPAVDSEKQAQIDALMGLDREVFRLDCANQHYRREVTLFGNGTIRVREGYASAPEMWLGELDTESTRALIARLMEPDLAEVPETSRTVVGEWVETCRYEVQLTDDEPQVFEFERLDALPLPLQKSLSVAITALGMIDRTRPSNTRGKLARDFVPERGDILVAIDGRKFRVSGFTTDRTGVELVGVEQPVVLFAPVADLHAMFLSRESPNP